MQLKIENTPRTALRADDTGAQRKTILFLHASAELYGSDRTLYQLVEGLDASRFRAVVALPSDGPLVGKLREAGAEVEIGPLGIGARVSTTLPGMFKLLFELPRAVRFVRRLTRRFTPCLIHTNTIVVLGGALGAWTTRLPHLWHVHEILPDRGFIARTLARLLDRFSTRIVSNSRTTRECLDELRPELSAKHRVILNGVAVDGATRRSPAEIRRVAGFAEDAPLVVLVGRINSWKGQALLVEAAERLARHFPRTRYLIVGDAPPGQDHFTHELDEMIRDAQLGGIVKRLPFTDDVSSVFAAADIVTVPSTRPEPFGLVAVEAMAEGSPVIAAEHGGLTEIVVEGETGHFFPPGDVDAFAQRLASLLAYPERARRFGANGRARQREHFSIARYRSQFLSMYESMSNTEASP